MWDRLSDLNDGHHVAYALLRWPEWRPALQLLCEAGSGGADRAIREHHNRRAAVQMRGEGNDCGEL